MKKQFLAMFLLFGVLAWTQTATQNPPNASQPPAQSSTEQTTKASCACGAKMASEKPSAESQPGACCPRMKESANADDKSQSCCHGKDASACMKDGKCGSADGCTDSAAKCCNMAGDAKSKSCCAGAKQCAMSRKQA